MDCILRSGIVLESQELSIPEKSSWVFFQSPKSVALVARNKPLLAQIRKRKIGALGPGTEKALEAFGLTAIFSGKGISIENDILDFIRILGENDHVCVLKGDKSLNRLVKALPDKSYSVEFLYRNKPLKMKNIPNSIALHFSSPSQFEAYFSSKKVEMESQIISIGKSTQALVESKGLKSILQTDFTDQSLISTLKKLLHK